MAAEYMVARYIRENGRVVRVIVDRVVFPEPVRSVTEELRRLAEQYQQTPEGKAPFCQSFFWGDFADLPAAFWEKHGIEYEPGVIESDVVVNNDELV